MRRFTRFGSAVTLLAIGLTGCLAAQAMASGLVFDISAGTATVTLKEFATQAHLQLLFDYQAVRKLRTPAVHGQLAAADALRQLLTGSGFTFREINDHTIAIVAPGNPASSAAGAQETEGFMLIRLADAVGAGAAPAAPSGGSAPAAMSDSGSPNGERLQEIVVTAAKRSEPISKAAVSVSAISGQELEDRNANSLQDYIAFIPGVALQSSGTPGYGAVSIRGVASQSVGATTATYVDGVPFGPTSALTESVYFTLDMNPTDLDRVEVLKGPQGTLYGASSMGGLIKYVTRSPDLYNTEFRAYEDFNESYNGSLGLKLSGAVSAPLIPGELAVRVNGYYVHDGGYITDTGFGGEDTNRGNDHGYHVAVLYQPLENLTLRLSAIGQDTAVHGNDAVDVNLATYQPAYGGWTQFRYAPEPFTNSIRLYSAELNYNMGKVNLVSASSYSSLNPISYSDETAIFASFGPPFSNFASPGTADWGYAAFPSHKVTEELRLVSDRMGPVEWMVGGFFQHEDVVDHVDLGQVALPGLDLANPVAELTNTFREGTLTEYAAFADGTYYLTPSFDITLGIRDSHISQTSYRGSAGLLNNPADPTQYATSYQTFSTDSNTYLADARWRITDDILWYLRAASGFRPGGGRTVPAGAPPGYADFFSPDSLWAYESGLKLRALDGRLTLTGDVFWINWTNIQTLAPVAGTPFINDGNAGTAISRGAELEVKFIPTQGLTLGANGAFTQAKFTETVPGIANNGQPLYYVPRFTATAYGEYSRAIGAGWNGFFGADYQYTDKELDTNQTPLPVHSIVNAHLGVRDPHYRINLYVNNLTNKMAFVGYENGGFGAPTYDFAVNPPRTVGISFAETF